MDETQQYFNDVAGQWDEMRRQFFGEGVRRAAVAAAQITPGAVVVDVGTGTGFLADAALEAGARVIGVDASEGMLEQVRKRFAGAAFEARAGEVDAIPVEDRSADAVLANMVLHHAPDPSHAIVEMTRILKQGGRLIITDADTHTHEWLRTEMHDRWLGFDRVDIARWFREAGLQEVSVTDTNELCTPSSQCGTQRRSRSSWRRGKSPEGPNADCCPTHLPGDHGGDRSNCRLQHLERIAARDADAVAILLAWREHGAGEDIDACGESLALDLDAVVANRQLDPENESAVRLADARALGKQSQHFLARRFDRSPQRHAQLFEVLVQPARLEELGHRQLRQAGRGDVREALQTLNLGMPSPGVAPSEIETRRDVVRER